MALPSLKIGTPKRKPVPEAVPLIDKAFPKPLSAYAAPTRPVRKDDAPKAAPKPIECHRTPPTLIDRLMDLFDPYDGVRCLAAGGHVSRMAEAFKTAPTFTAWTVDAVEQNHDEHADVREAGVKLLADDFLAFNSERGYDCIALNPPVDEDEARKFIEHAWSILNPGSRLIVIGNRSLGDMVDAMAFSLPGEVQNVEYEKCGEATILIADKPSLGFHPKERTEAARDAILTNDEAYKLAVSLIKRKAALEQFASELGRYVNAGGAGYGVRWKPIMAACAE